MAALLSVFRDQDDADAVLDRLSERGIDRENVGISWRETTVRTEEDVEVITYVDHFESPGSEAKKGALGGLIGGAAAGAGTVLLATVGLRIGPEIITLIGVETAVAVAVAAGVGATIGGVSGGLFGALLGAADHDATKVKTVDTEFRDSIERDSFVLTLEIDPDRSEEIASALNDAGADETSLLGADESQLRIQLD